MVAISLIASGLPFAHAMPQQAQSSGLSHHATAHHASHHELEHAASVSDHADRPDNTVADLISGPKCCSMCATAYVAPALGSLDVIRIGFVVRYRTLAAARSDTPISIDPGIPIV